jgi:HAD superfamily hydrolase (TIGR01458 family)
LTDVTAGLSGISGYLIDLDGTVYVGRRPIKGAVETINRLREHHIPFRFTTNTTTKSNATLLGLLTDMGVPVEADEIFGVITAAVAFLRAKGSPRCQLLLTDDPKEDFAEFPEDGERPEYIVIGDIGKYWDYQLVNDLFRKIMHGAGMIALHKGRYWETENGLQVDIGAFVAGLEYVTGKTATVIGKPSESFFQLALEDLGLPAEKVAMVGDDLISDIGGAQAVGMKGILVKTGKYRAELVAQSEVKPDLVIDSLGELGSIV